MGIETRVVKTPKEVIAFSCKIHFSLYRANGLMGKEFYEKWCEKGEIPDGVMHYELELPEAAIWEDRPHTAHVHFYTNTDSTKTFVWWPGLTSVTTLERAKRLFHVWAVGTAFTLIHDEDYLKHYKDDEAFLKLMKNEYGIYT